MVTEANHVGGLEALLISGYWLTMRICSVKDKMQSSLVKVHLYIIFLVSAYSEMHQHPVTSFRQMDSDGLDHHGFLSLKATLIHYNYIHTAKQSPCKEI